MGTNIHFFTIFFLINHGLNLLTVASTFTVNDLLNEVYKTDFNSPSLFSISSISRKKRSLTGSSQNTKFDNATTANNEIPENFVKSKPYDEMTDKEIQDEETALTTIVYKGTVQGT